MRSRKDRWRRWRKAGLAIAGLLLFVLALELMKEGAKGLAPFLRGHLEITHVADSLGFGWLMAYLILSGSPVAAAAVALLSARALTALQGFTMIAGSRLGASSIVLLIGFIYHALRGQERWIAYTPGVLSFIITGSLQLAAVPLGLLLLGQGWTVSLSPPSLERLSVGVNRGLDPLLRPLAALLPDGALFVLGVGLAMLSFRLFDQVTPQIRLERTDFDQVPRLVYRPEVMFLTGLAITLVTMSVSLSVSILVPLSARGYMRRENIIPYILGANISTMVDTLIAAALLGDPQAVAVVLTYLICATLASLPIVLLAYRPYEWAVSRLLAWITRRRRNFAFFLAVIVLLPVVLILL